MNIFHSDIFKGMRKRDRIIGEMAFDVNSKYTNIAHRFAAAKSALAATSLGRSGQLQIIADGDLVKYYSPATRQTFDTIQDAIDEVSKYSFSEVKVFGKKLPHAPYVHPKLDKYSVTASIYEDISNKLINFTDAQKNVLIDAGIDVSNLDSLEMGVFTFNAGNKGGISKLAKDLNKFREKGKMQGLITYGDEGARLINFRIGAKELNEYQSALILSMTKHHLHGSTRMLQALSSGNSQQMASGIFNILEKSAKRQKGFLSGAEIALEGESLKEILGNRTLEESTLIIDPQYEILSMFAGGRKFKFKDVYEEAKGSQLDIYYKKLKNKKTPDGKIVGVDKHIDEIIANLGLKKNPSKNDLKELKESINKFNKNRAPRTRWASDALEEHLMQDFVLQKGKKNQYRADLVEGLFKNIEQSYDGADLINHNFIDKYIKSLKKEMEDKKLIIDDKLSPAVAKEQAKRDLSGLRLKMERILDGDLSQIILRGRINVDQLGEFRNIKSAAYATQHFEMGLKDFYAIISKHSLKEETSLGGDISSIMLSGIGAKGENVYADPVATAFHPEIFASEDAIRAMELRGQKVLSEYQGFIETGILPHNIESLLERQARFDGSHLAAAERLSGERNAQIAQMLLDVHRTSNIADSPFLMSLLHKRMATEAFRDKKGFLQPVMPDTFRFAIASEQAGLGLSGGGGYGNLWGTSKYGYDKVSLTGTTGASKDIDALLFRVEDNRIVIPHFATGKFFHSLGGFDLDDKGLPRLVTYEDTVKGKQLGTYIFRQPSGPEEVVFARMKFDQNTIKKLFNHDYFIETLDEVIEREELEGNDVKSYKDLSSILKEKKPNIKSTELELEKAILETLEEAESKKRTSVYKLGQDAIDRLIKHGASSLKVEDFGVDPKYSKYGIEKLMLEKLDAPDLTDFYKEAAKGTQFEAMLHGAKDIEEINKILKNAKVDDDVQLSLLTAAYQKYASKIAENQSGALGVYINRSMAVGSSLNQIGDFAKEIEGSPISKFIEDNRYAYTAGLLSQETAIDLAKNVSISQTINKNIRNIIGNNLAIDVDKLGGALGELYGLAQGGQAVTTEQIGSAAIESIGRMAGLSRAFMVKDSNKHLQIGLDEFIINQRMTHLDRVAFIESATRGMQDVLDNRQLLAHAQSLGVTEQEIRDRIERYKDISSKSKEDVKQTLLDDFSLKDVAYNKYASISKIQKIGQAQKRAFDLLTRNRIHGIGQDAILSLSQTTDQARGAAEKIIDTHAAALHEVFKEFKGNWEDADELSTYLMSARFSEVGHKIFENIHDAAQIEGVSGEHLANAMEKILLPLGIDLKRIFPLMNDEGKPVSDKALSGYQILTKGENLRRYKYYEGLDQTTANEALSRIQEAIGLESGAGPFDLGSRDLRGAARVARRNLEENETLVLKDEAHNTILALAGDAGEIENKLDRKTAQVNAAILENRFDRESKLADDFSSIEQMGNVSDFAGMGPDVSISEEIFKSAHEGIYGEVEDLFVKKPIYKRWAEKWGEKEFQDLISRPEIKHSLYAGAALIAGSFIYSRHKDRTQSDMTGPPLLPGGSPYETRSQKNIPQLETSDGRSYNTGVNYQVHIFGEGDNVQKFHKAAGGLAKGNMNTTMYNRIPNVGKNPYSSFMSSF